MIAIDRMRFMMQGREQRKDVQLREVSTELLQSRNEMSRMEAMNNQLQGHGLESLDDHDLSNIVNQISQASPIDPPALT